MIGTDGRCSICLQYVGEATWHSCSGNAYPTGSLPTPSSASSNPIEQLLAKLDEIMRVLRDIEYYVRTR